MRLIKGKCPFFVCIVLFATVSSIVAYDKPGGKESSSSAKPSIVADVQVNPDAVPRIAPVKTFS